MRESVPQKKSAATRDWTRAKIKAGLEERGWTLRRLSAENGLAPDTLRHTLRARWPRGEQIIAQALGTDPAAIWPSRYKDQQNRRTTSQVV